MHRCLVAVAFFLLGLLFATPATATPPDLIAEVVLESSTVRWTPQQHHDRMYLQVRGPNKLTLRRSFAAGTSPSLEVDDDQAVMPDGKYTYTLVVGSTGTTTASNLRAQKGTFRLVDGSPKRPTGAAPLAQVVNDDQIIQGSLCVGNDCASDENFEFDTVRLSENNLRLHFNDTSSSNSFPANDWRIVVNDSENDGDNYFAIDDATNSVRPFTVQANSVSDALVVSNESQGYIGMGTDTPASEIHVSHGDTPTLRLDQDGSNGYGQYTWDVASNEANFFVRNVTNGSRLPFRLFPDARDDGVVVTSNRVGLGTSQPTASLHLTSDAPSIRIENTATSTDALRLDENGNLTLSGVLTEASSRHLKAERRPVHPDSVLARLADVSIETWTYKADANSIRHMGPMAQDFYGAFGLGVDAKHIAPLDANGVALASVQALLKRIERQSRRIDHLEQKTDRLSSKTKALEARIEQLEQLVQTEANE